MEPSGKHLHGPAEILGGARWVSVMVGLLMILCAFLVDRRTREDFAFWGYLFGLFSFWGGLSWIGGGSELELHFAMDSFRGGKNPLAREGPPH